MKIVPATRLLLSSLLLLLCLSFTVTASAAPSPNHLVIAEVYGGGSNSSAAYANDYVMLYNPTAAAISLSGYSLQYASATGTSWTSETLPSDSVQPGHYYLIGLYSASQQSGTNVGAALPTPDFQATSATYLSSGSVKTQNYAINMSASAGKVLLSNSATIATVSCPVGLGTTVDFVGFGATANCYEGTGPAPNASSSNSTSVSRKDPTVDTDDNSADFKQLATATPHNSSYVAVSAVSATIAQLQANRSTYVGNPVQTSGVVTSVIYNGFFLQMPNASPASRTTGISEGIDVYTGSAPTVHVGDNITVTGPLTLFPAASASVTPALEISSPTVVTNSTGNPLPTPITLTTADLTPNGGLQQLTRYESMRVQMSLTSTSGTGAASLSGSTEVNETYTSNGYFYAVITGTPRPFREPGVDIRDAGASALPSTVQRFDDNPERIYVATTLMNGAPLDVSTGATFNNVTGILDFTYSNDSYYDPSRFIPDAGSLTASYTPGIQPVAAALPRAGQATVAAFNIERFFNTSSADDKDFYAAANNGAGAVETSDAVDITPAAYARRLAKVSLAIRHMLNNPDILAIEEAENGFVLKDIAAQISSDAITAGEPDPKYVAYGTDNSTFYSDDESGISVGFLAKSTVDVTGFDQFFNTTTFTPSGGSLTTVNDRPPMVLHAGIQRGAGVKDYPVTVIVNHLKALPDNTLAVQQKKELQVEELASLFQGYQANGEHVLAVGDFNAFEFNDGYGDYLGTATNNIVAPPATTVTPGKSGLVTPAPTDLALTLPANLRYSYVESGSAQILDHIIASADIAGSTSLAYVHFDADFPNTLYNDATTPARTSDHDPALAYLTVPAPVSGAALSGSSTFPTTQVGASSAGQIFTLTNTGETPVTITTIATTGDFAATSNCGTSLAVNSTCAINVVFTPTASGTRTGTITFSGTTATGSVSASGTLTGSASDFTLDGGAAQTTLTISAGNTGSGGNTGSKSITLAGVNGFTGTVTFTCAAQGTAPTGVTCTPPAAIALSSAAATSTATFTFTATSRVATMGIASTRNGNTGRYLILIAMLAAAAFAVGRAGRKLQAASLLALLLALAAGISGCGHTALVTPSNGGTPSGTYNYTVKATSGTTVHTEVIALTVN